jgi:hypothetical protein
LQFGVVGPAVDSPFLQFLGYDLSDTRAAHALFGGDFVVGKAVPQPGENASLPEDHAVPADPPTLGGRLVFDHATSPDKVELTENGSG